MTEKTHIQDRGDKNLRKLLLSNTYGADCKHDRLIYTYNRNIYCTTHRIGVKRIERFCNTYTKYMLDPLLITNVQTVAPNKICLPPKRWELTKI